MSEVAQTRKGYVYVVMTPGCKWIPEYKVVSCWGGYENKDSLDEYIDEGTYQTQQGDGRWVKDDYFQGGVMNHRRGLWFALPKAVYDELFAPKFNDWGEIAP